MKTRFVRLYLLATGIVLTLTALAKWPAIFHPRNWCADASILGNFQPASLSNERLLGIAASTELLIVLLICFSPWRWLPCILTAAWGLICFFGAVATDGPSCELPLSGLAGQAGNNNQCHRGIARARIGRRRLAGISGRLAP